MTQNKRTEPQAAPTEQEVADASKQVTVTAHQLQIAHLLDLVAHQARQHAEELSVMQVNHSIEVQALKQALAADGRLSE